MATKKNPDTAITCSALTSINQRIGLHLKYVRVIQQEKTQEDAANEFFLDCKTWQRYERGESCLPIPLMIALHDKWGVDINWLLTDEQVENRPYPLKRRKESVHKGSIYGPKAERKQPPKTCPVK